MKNCYVFLIFVISVLPGCATMLGIGESEYACKGRPEGVRCLSASEVYTATESSDYVKISAPTTDLDSENSIEEDFFEEDIQTEVVKTSVKKKNKENGLLISTEKINSGPVVATFRKPRPIRIPAKVMRIWFAPWEDESGRLMVTNFVYNELEKRRWSIGGMNIVKDVNVTPFQGSESVPDK